MQLINGPSTPYINIPAVVYKQPRSNGRWFSFTRNPRKEFKAEMPIRYVRWFVDKQGLSYGTANMTETMSKHKAAKLLGTIDSNVTIVDAHAGVLSEVDWSGPHEVGKPPVVGRHS